MKENVSYSTDEVYIIEVEVDISKDSNLNDTRNIISFNLGIFVINLKIDLMSYYHKNFFNLRSR